VSALIIASALRVAAYNVDDSTDRISRLSGVFGVLGGQRMLAI